MSGFTFPKSRRLKSKKIISSLFTDGDTIKAYPLVGYYRFIDHSEPKHDLLTAFSVSKRKFRKAVQRNRIKRVMRESFRLEYPDFDHAEFDRPGYIALIILYVGADLPKYSLIRKGMKKLIRKLSACHQRPLPSGY